MKPVQSFVIKAVLPERIEKIRELAYNYWWCWNSEAKELFLRMNRDIWEEVAHNPVQLINRLSSEELELLADQKEFTSFLDYIHDNFVSYMNDSPWYESQKNDNDGLIAYFSMEYGINESFPNYSGGLGVLSGDHLKSSSDLGLPLIGIGLLYQQGYFRQHLTQHGWQTEVYNFNEFEAMPLILIRDKDGNPITLDVDLPYGKAYFHIWSVNVGRIKLYLLDTNIEQNQIEEYRDITDQLYGGTRDTRMQQEIVLGIGGTRAIYAMGFEPSVFHINEGHAAFALLERARYYMTKYGLDFYTAIQIVKSSSVFTTHTPVPAGNESFKFDRMETYLGKYYQNFGLNKEQFYNLGQVGYFNQDEGFSMTILGLRLTGSHNGVSKLHGAVARDMWHELWRDLPTDEVPIGHITNGIHTKTWIAREIAELFDRYLSPRWQTETDDPNVWKNIELIPNEELWREKQRRRVRLVLFTREHMRKRNRSINTIDKNEYLREYLDPDALTIGFARRFATYKRATLLFTDMDRLKRILTNEEKPVQVLIAGKAHPHDTMGKEVIQSIHQKVKEYQLEHKVVFLEDYDMVIARFLVKGCDVWLNNPIRPMEASGTSGMKAALNGTLNLSILDGWWDEGYDGFNGFSIGSGEEYDNQDEQNSIEAGSLYEVLENQVISAFYDRSRRNKVPDKWVEMMKNTIITNAWRFSTHRMLKDYATMYYIPAMSNYNKMVFENGRNAIEYKNWKDKIISQWNNVGISEVVSVNNHNKKVGDPIEVTCSVSLGKLLPNDVLVEVYFGQLDHHGNIINANKEELKCIASEGNRHTYSGVYICKENGKQGFTVRVLPNHELQVTNKEMHLCKWSHI